MKLRPFTVLLLIGSSSGTQSARADANALLALLPENTAAAVATDDLGKTWQYRVAHSSQKQPADDWGEVFGVPSDSLAKVLRGGLVRAKVSRKSKGSSAKLLIFDVIVADVEDEEGIQEVLNTARRKVSRPGTKWSRESIRGTQRNMHLLPATSKSRAVVHAVFRNHMILCDDVTVAKQIAGQVEQNAQVKQNGQPASNPAWDSVRPRLNLARENDQNQLVWFLDPWRWPEPKTTKENDEWMNYATAKRHGLTSIEAVGGIVVVAKDGARIGQTVVHAPAPRKSTLRVFDLSPAKSLELPVWVPRDIEGVTLLHGDIPRASNYIGPLFDDVMAEGVEGTFEEVLQDLKDPDGLDIDLKDELFAHLGPRAVLMSGQLGPKEKKDAAPPFLLAFETANAGQVTKAIDLLMKDDPEAKKVKVADCQAWRIESENRNRSPAVGVARDYCFFTDDIRLLQHVLSFDEKQQLATDPGVTTPLERILDSQKRSPCVLIAGGRLPMPKTNNDAVSSGWMAPWDLLFQGQRDLRPIENVWNRTLFIGDHRVAVGFVDEDGWSFVTAAPRPTPSSK
jgi:hypothetical protein